MLIISCSCNRPSLPRNKLLEEKKAKRLAAKVAYIKRKCKENEWKRELQTGPVFPSPTKIEELEWMAKPDDGDVIS